MGNWADDLPFIPESVAMRKHPGDPNRAFLRPADASGLSQSMAIAEAPKMVLEPAKKGQRGNLRGASLGALWPSVNEDDKSVVC
jgi:hypothetical protein